ncbi:hypothetical protein CXX93_12450 [Gordonia sp. YC-JH1]|nr:hypothetical protein CXX93_12450 [Gordonia sp. YC-JH1]
MPSGWNAPAATGGESPACSRRQGCRWPKCTAAARTRNESRGKSDPLDAVAAARAVLAGDGIAIPKDERTNMVRALHLTQRGAGPRIFGEDLASSRSP